MKDISDLMIKVGELDLDEHLNGKSMYLMDISSAVTNEEYNLLIQFIENKNLCKLHRDLVISESFEAIKPIEDELKRRGYSINIGDKIINYIPKIL